MAKQVKRTLDTPPSGVPQDKLSFDMQLVDIYLTGLQSEVEAKVRRVGRFREQMRKIDAAGGRTHRPARELAARTLIAQINEMLASNLTVRDTLQELLVAAKTMLEDLREEASEGQRGGSPQNRGAAPAGSPDGQSRSAPRRAAAAKARKG